MSEPQTITPDHLRTLLDAEDGATSLTLIEGRVQVLTPDQRGTDEFAGALEVISRDDLVAQLGVEPSDAEVTTEAGALTASVQQLGG